MEVYILGYFILSAIYSLYFSYKLGKFNIGTFTLLALVTTFPLHILMFLSSVFYRPFGVYISYMVTLNEKK